MHDVLKLYFGLRAKCLWRMIKELGLMVIPALLLFSLLGTLMVLGLVYAPIYYSVLFYSFLLLACHFMRGDSIFLYSVFGVKRTKMLFSVEYMLLSFPFLCFFLHRDELWAVAIVLLPFMIAWYVPCGGFSLRLPTFPCLASGSYEYHRTGRLTMPLFLPLMAGGAIGAYDLAENAQHASRCAMLLALNYVKLATSYAESCGGGGVSNLSGWGRNKDEDDEQWWVRCIATASAMVKPRGRKKTQGISR